ncbi:MAG: hypothetical protein J7K14_09290 [Sulfurimonas sp.]|nr:hypothetical protein [Sulfurimonas sp.]
MEVSSQTNSFGTMNMHQKPITTPVEPKEPTYGNGEIYEASQGNLIRNDDEIVLTPQGQNSVANAQEDKTAEAEARTQAKQDQRRENGADYIAHQSKQSQVEIYLSVATDSDVDLGNSTANVIETLRDVQKQNDAVEAYAKYQENQNGSEILQ